MGQPFFLRIKLLIVQAIDVYLTLERFVERHISLCARHALHVQNLVEDGAHKVFVINAVEFYHQAQFNPMKYANGLCEYITNHGGLIFENSKVTKLKKDENL